LLENKNLLPQHVFREIDEGFGHFAAGPRYFAGKVQITEEGRYVAFLNSLFLDQFLLFRNRWLARYFFPCATPIDGRYTLKRTFLQGTVPQRRPSYAGAAVKKKFFPFCPIVTFSLPENNGLFIF